MANEKEVKPAKKSEAPFTKVVLEEILVMTALIQLYLSEVAQIFHVIINRIVPQHNWCSHEKKKLVETRKQERNSRKERNLKTTGIQILQTRHSCLSSLLSSTMIMMKKVPKILAMLFSVMLAS